MNKNPKTEMSEDNVDEEIGRWLPLESNPDLLNGFLKRMGVDESVQFHDVFGLDEELLCMVPGQPVAVCLLFPSDTINAIRRPTFSEENTVQNPQDKNIFYLDQLPRFGNACGTIACVHAVANVPSITFEEGSPLQRFIEENRGLKSSEIGLNLATAKDIHEASESSAQGGQTSTPDRDDSVEGHFITFVNIDDNLYELDGMMPGVIHHGKTSADRFLIDAAKVIQEQFMQLDPSNVNFNVTCMSIGGLE